MTTPSWLNDVKTPYLLIDKDKVKKNIKRLQDHIIAKNAMLRPHLKTLKSVGFADFALASKDAPATVSTLAEAEGFAKAGYTNLLYAVGISPDKLPRVEELIKRGTTVHVLVDSLAQAIAINDYTLKKNIQFSVFIEIDCDGHRGGLLPESPLLLPIARKIAENGSKLQGLMTHAGESYHCNSVEEIRAAAEIECNSVLIAAERIRSEGIDCPTLSIGSTPTAHFVENLDGINEVRAGVFSTFDLFMKNVGVCEVEDIAISVITTVIGFNEEKKWLLVDAGWMALSKDRGTASQSTDYKYGLVCDLSGTSLGVCIENTSQEHGIIQFPENNSLNLSDFPVGTKLKIIPNHACATAAMHQTYEVISNSEQERTQWNRILGW